MLELYVLRDRLKRWYGKYSIGFLVLLRFLLAWTAIVLLNSSLGYMKPLRSPVISLVLSLICGVCPFGGICWILAFFMLAHIFAVSLEFALFTTVLLLTVALLYYGFAPGDSVLLIVTPLLFAWKIPYIIPLLVGLGGALVSVIPMCCGIVIYYILQYVRANAGPLTNGSSLDITQKYVQMLNGVLLNRTMLTFLLAFAVAVIVVYLIRTLPILNAWNLAIFAGVLAILLSFFAAAFFYGIRFELLPLLGGCALAAAVATVFQFFVFNVDYTRMEYTQFEDDDYHYFVKAVPKVSVSVPKMKLQKLNRAKRPKRSRGSGDESKR